MLNQSQFNEIVGRIGARQKLLNKDIQACAMFAIYKSIVDRNSTPADVLFQAMSAGMRKQALVNYFEKYGNLAYLKNDPKTGATKPHMAFFDVEAMTGIKPIYNEADLADKPWYEAGGKEQISSSLDIQERVAALIKQIKNAQKGDKREVLHAEYLPVLEAIAAGDEINFAD